MDKLASWDRNLAISTTDVIVNGAVVRDVATPSVLVTQQSDLSNLNGYPPGTIAYTAAFKGMWQKNADGSWVSLL